MMNAQSVGSGRSNSTCHRYRVSDAAFCQPAAVLVIFIATFRTNGHHRTGPLTASQMRNILHRTLSARAFFKSILALLMMGLAQNPTLSTQPKVR